jgi:hypothetical protein
MPITRENAKGTREQALNLYPKFRALPFSAKQIQDLSLDEVFAHLRTSSGKNVDPKNLNLMEKETKQATAAFRCAIAVAKKYSEKEFVDFWVNQDIPPVELTNQDMEQLKGGFFWVLIGLWTLLVDFKSGYEAYHN